MAIADIRHGRLESDEKNDRQAIVNSKLDRDKLTDFLSKEAFRSTPREDIVVIKLAAGRHTAAEKEQMSYELSKVHGNLPEKAEDVKDYISGGGVRLAMRSL
ncbi:hypothetical protein CPC08DRAFT_763438 [Agrocybe pediades]|nr:hypothetical protein CPC08DRAFT_763438 [Agrocybe pediades]